LALWLSAALPSLLEGYGYGNEKEYAEQ